MNVNCRTCLKQITNHNTVSWFAEQECKRKLMLCVPELNLQSVSDLKLCSACQAALDTAYNFKLSCRKVEGIICNYLKEHGVVDLEATRQIHEIDHVVIKQEEVNLDEHDAKAIEDVKQEICLNMFEVNSSELHTPLVFKCSKCVYTGNDKADLRAHNLQCHVRKPEAKMYTCWECLNFETDKKSKLKMHALVHSGKKIFECEECDYKTKYKTAFANHGTIHTGVKPFKCEYCEYSAATKASLRIHKFKHNTTPMLQCPKCNFTASKLIHLNRHVLKHADEKQLNCLKCGFKTPHVNTLRSHMRTHANKKRYKCPECVFQTTNQMRLECHVIYMHRNSLFNRLKKMGIQHDYLNQIGGIAMDDVQKKQLKCSHCNYRTYRKPNLDKHKVIHEDKMVIEVVKVKQEIIPKIEPPEYEEDMFCS